MRIHFFILSAVALLGGCVNDTLHNVEKTQDPQFLHKAAKKLTDVIVHDIFSPPVASRIYAYSSIAAYEAGRYHDSTFLSLEGQLKGFSNVPKPDPTQEYCFPLAGVHAFLLVGKKLIFSEDSIAQFHDQILKEYQHLGLPSKVYKRSLAFGEAVAAHVMNWSDKDNYKQTRTFPKFSIHEQPERWQPTPPSYMQAIEPHWREIRTFVLDSAQQFVPPPPTVYNENKDSPFMEEVMEVYEALKANDKSEREAIASFWDCNPYVSHVAGHVMFATKKITPGGHWMGIAGLVSQKAGAGWAKSSQAYALTSISLADAFISCWDEKYRSNLVRPETVINRLVDPDWVPLLQTPPFPEYTSGHSVISRSAATALTSIFGDNFSFVDSVEVEYGLPARSFTSFIQASEEAAVSRLYGGIHYRPAIVNGVGQGEKVGKFIVQRLKWN